MAGGVGLMFQRWGWTKIPNERVSNVQGTELGEFTKSNLLLECCSVVFVAVFPETWKVFADPLCEMYFMREVAEPVFWLPSQSFGNEATRTVHSGFTKVHIAKMLPVPGLGEWRAPRMIKWTPSWHLNFRNSKRASAHLWRRFQPRRPGMSDSPLSQSKGNSENLSILA